MLDGVLGQRLEQVRVLGPNFDGAVASSSTRFDISGKVVVGRKDAPVPNRGVGFVNENVRDAAMEVRLRYVLVGEHHVIQCWKRHCPCPAEEGFWLVLKTGAAGDLTTGFGKAMDKALHQPLAAARDNAGRILPHRFFEGVQGPRFIGEVPQSASSMRKTKFRMCGDQQGIVTMGKVAFSRHNSSKAATDDENLQVTASMLRASTGQLGRQWSHKVHASSSTTARHPTRRRASKGHTMTQAPHP